jgi:hypothetical protein
LGHPRITNEEIDRRGKALYEQSIRSQVESGTNIGKLVIIDVETGDYEIDTDGIAASDRLLARHPDAAFYGQRIGYDTAYSFDGVLSRTKR